MAINPIEARIVELVSLMTIEEKIGQMIQTHYAGEVSADMRGNIAAGRIGSLLNVVDADVANELQRIAAEESRLGIPLLLARDVIHGFRTILPIPLGQASTWNPELVERGTRVAALEAAKTGVNWALAPMIDIARDPRWGRIAESFGEDPYLTSRFAVAMVEGYQGDDLSAPGTIAASAKHFAGYGATEYEASILAADPDGDTLSYRWEIMRESEATEEGGDLEDVPERIDGLASDSGSESVRVIAPPEPGAYRLFAYVYDGEGNAGHANIPFYVE